ncbi:VOC family protein [Streptomyces sp. NPDC059761]|uniref:VOC family protein n=1 Tax=Streptomyces sp. NPDC059761 TaxID=3346937 RepID=UPI003664AAC7
MSLTDAHWARIEPSWPERTPRRGGRWRDHRQLIDAIAFKYRTGAPWMDLPQHFGPRVWFQQVPEPKVAKNRWHFDLKVGGGRDIPLDVRTQRVKATVERLVKAGATVLRIKGEPDMGLYAVAMQDPEGSEFDVA